MRGSPTETVWTNGTGLELEPGKLSPEMNWLPDMDLNHDKQIQSLLCYRYTIGQ